MTTWLEECGLDMQKVERCIELATEMEHTVGYTRRVHEAKLLGFLEGLGFGFRRKIYGISHACEIINIPWKKIGEETKWGNDALAPDDPRRDKGKRAPNMCDTQDLTEVFRSFKTDKKITHSVVTRLKNKARKERLHPGQNTP